MAKSKWKSLKTKLKRLTRKTTPTTFDERIATINQTLRGWINYFRLASIHQKLKSLEHWLRNRLRYCIWHQWKKPEKKRRSLIRLGIDPDTAYVCSRTRMGGWLVAQSPILGTTITLEILLKTLKSNLLMSILFGLILVFFNEWALKKVKNPNED